MIPIISNEKMVEEIVDEIFSRIHSDGAVSGSDLESLSFIKEQYPKVFEKFEPTLMYLLGLFFKSGEPQNVTSVFYNEVSKFIDENIGQGLTPVQASIKNKIDKNTCFSFSAPTSAGKSHLFRDLILNSKGNVVFVLPSRALLHEYILKIEEIVNGMNTVIVLPFIDVINTKKAERYIYVVTPERASEIFNYQSGKIDVEVFLLDEAQLADDVRRGPVFDAFVRRARKRYPNAKFVFAHPFIDNPGAQLKKHGFTGESYNYQHHTVGKVFIELDKKNRFHYFSPYTSQKKMLLDHDPIERILKEDGSILIYSSKAKVIDSNFINSFSKYISLLKPIEDKEALLIISEIEKLIAAEGKRSSLLNYLQKGILIHHGSVPLKVRSYLEKFANKGFARICFATTTLVQGVNIPFSAVWIHSNRFHGTESERNLALKNLIGRAGRISNKTNHFDYGYVFTNNAKKLKEKIEAKAHINEVSMLDVVDAGSEDEKVEDYKASILEDSFSDEFNMPNERMEKLNSKESHSVVQFLLDTMFSGGLFIKADDFDASKDQDKMKASFRYIFEKYLNRSLSGQEEAVLSTAIRVLIWQIEGKSFREILIRRYNYLTKIHDRRKIAQQFKEGILSQKQYEEKMNSLYVYSSPAPFELPNKKMSGEFPFSNFKKIKVVDLNYDILVYDTYDYLDKVITNSLSPVFYTAFKLFYDSTSDVRAMSLANFFKYGTNHPDEIMLLRYGFSFEDLEWVLEHVEEISESEIKFFDSVDELPIEKLEIIKKFK